VEATVLVAAPAKLLSKSLSKAVAEQQMYKVFIELHAEA